MPLPEPILDDLRFQRDLVDEARRRIIRYCPEWTDYNLSDPGITLIELFAWMTELLTYRLNRVPEKNYIHFLDLLGVQLQPPSSAHTELTFWLSTPFPIRPDDTTVAIVPEATEVTTQRLDAHSEVTFTTDRQLVIAPPRLAQLRREGEINKNYLPRLKVESFTVFQQTPQIGDTFYLGFEEEPPLAGQILQLAFECDETQATGIRREDPPLIWEGSTGNGCWQELRPSSRKGEEDTTGGLLFLVRGLSRCFWRARSSSPPYPRRPSGYWGRPSSAILARACEAATPTSRNLSGSMTANSSSGV